MKAWRKGWLYAVDPGTANAGIAAFYNGHLVGAWKLRNPSPRQFANIAAGNKGVWVREKMQKYPKNRVKHKALDAIEDLMARLGRMVGGFDAEFRPRAWKGTIPKDKHHKRLERVLDPSEAEHWENDPDIRDAIGIGLYALGRVKAGGAPT